jgi:hypothetical protein
MERGTFSALEDDVATSATWNSVRRFSCCPSARSLGAMRRVLPKTKQLAAEAEGKPIDVNKVLRAQAKERERKEHMQNPQPAEGGGS